MIASASYEDYCDLTDGRCDRSAEAEAREETEALLSLFATEPLGGEGMETQQVFDVEELEAEFLGDHDGDDGDESDDDAELLESVEDHLSCLDETSRAIAAGNALASCADDIATITVLEWLCKVGSTARVTIAKQALELIANEFDRKQRSLTAARDRETQEHAEVEKFERQVSLSHAEICELLAVVSPHVFGAEAE